MAFLCISLNNSSVNVVHILDGELLDIDKYTGGFNNANEILREFPDKVRELNNRFNLDRDESDIKVRIFLSNDKEQFVMYKRHIVAFKYLMRKRKFLRYAVSYDSSIFSKMVAEIINSEKLEDTLVLDKLGALVSNYDEDKLYVTIRKICEQYNNYLEDNEDENNPTIEDIYKTYLSHVKPSRLIKQTKNLTVKEEKKPNSPFAVFEHPNFFKVYGGAIKKDKPIFILGDKLDNDSKYQYKELYDNCKKCFNNQIYCPLNYDLMGPVDDEFREVYDNALLVIINGNGYNRNLIDKINLSIKNNITILILVSTDEMKKFYNKYYSKFSDNVIIKDYQYDEFNSKKQFADIMAGLYINEFKKLKSKEVQKHEQVS